MQALRWRVVVLWVTGVLWSPALMQAQSLPLGPRHDAGQSITAAFEGWFPNQDGTYSILLGYYNRNRKEDLGDETTEDSSGGPDVEQVPRTWRRHLQRCETYRGTRKSGSGRRWRERDRFYLGYLQRARRIHPARCGQRLVGKRRARISVLLDECSGKSFRKALSNPAG